MGTSAAPNMANIYLHVYEHEYFPYLYENNFNNKLAKLKNIFIHQYKIYKSIYVNDDGIFQEEVISKIYPPEMASQ